MFICHFLTADPVYMPASSTFNTFRSTWHVHFTAFVSFHVSFYIFNTFQIELNLLVFVIR